MRTVAKTQLLNEQVDLTKKAARNLKHSTKHYLKLSKAASF